MYGFPNSWDTYNDLAKLQSSEKFQMFLTDAVVDKKFTLEA